MNKSAVFHALILLLGVFISSISQVLLKKAAMNKSDSLIKEYLNPKVIIAYVLFFASTLLSVLAYRGIPLSLGPVLEATGYFYVTYFGVKIFGEKLGRTKMAALILIISGIVVYALFG